jgi:hypothetical protein
MELARLLTSGVTVAAFQFAISPAARCTREAARRVLGITGTSSMHDAPFTDCEAVRKAGFMHVFAVQLHLTALSVTAHALRRSSRLLSLQPSDCRVSAPTSASGLLHSTIGSWLAVLLAIAVPSLVDTAAPDSVLLHSMHCISPYTARQRLHHVPAHRPSSRSNPSHCPSTCFLGTMNKCFASYDLMSPAARMRRNAS